MCRCLPAPSLLTSIGLIVLPAGKASSLYMTTSTANRTNVANRATSTTFRKPSVNSSRQEQFDRLRLLHDPFLRNEAFLRNIFMHLVLIHRRNRSLNEDALFKLELQIEHAHKVMPQFKFTLKLNLDTGRIEIRSQRR